MTRYLLCDVLGLASFLFAFWPIARSAGRQARVSMAGWCFLLVHYAALFAGNVPGYVAGEVAETISMAATGLCALCFFRAAAEQIVGTETQAFFLEASAAVLMESALLAFGVRSLAMHSVGALLFGLSALQLMGRTRSKWAAAFPLGGVFLVLGGLCVLLASRNPSLAGAVIPGVLFLAAAGLTQATRRPGMGIGLLLMTVGMVGWGVSLPLALWIPAEGAGGMLLAELPQYLVACGMIMSLLHHHVGRMEELALVDSLTGLPNTRHLESRFDRVFAMSAQHGNPIAFLVIDVDRFKQINDSLGQSTGDELLKALAVRLAWHIGPRDTLARSGGDDFIALLVSEHDEHHLHFIARAMIAAVGVPVSVGEHTIAITISAGIAVSAGGAHALPVLRRAADNAMYQAKRNGGGQLVIAQSPH